MIGLLWLWPVRQGWEAYSYQPAATFDPSGQIVAVFDGKDSEASRLEVSYVSSPALDPEQPVDVELRFQTTWGSEHAPSILFLGAMATKLESCVASAAVLTTKQVAREDLTEAQRRAVTTVVAAPEANGKPPKLDDETVQNAWAQLSEVPIVALSLDSESTGWQKSDFSYTREDLDIDTTFHMWEMPIMCSFEPSAMWGFSSTSRTLNFPTVAAYSNPALGEKIVLDNANAESALVLSREVRLKSSGDWSLWSTTSTSTFQTDGYRVFNNGWRSHDMGESTLSGTGFSVMFSDRQAETRERSAIFVAGIAAGVAAGLAISVLKNLVLFGLERAMGAELHIP